MTLFEAPIGLMQGRRRPLRPGHVLVTIEDLLILSWRVPAPRLRAALPGALRPVQVEGSAFVSALLFRNRGLRPAWLGIPRLACTQLNLRSYVVDPRSGRAGSVYFHGFHLGTPWIAWVASRLFGFRCGRLSLEIDVERDEEGVRWRGVSDAGVRVTARASHATAEPSAAILDLLTNVHTGYVPGRRAGTLRRWSIWHRNQRVRAMQVSDARIAPLDELQLGLQAPDFAFLVDSVDYEVYLPTRAAVASHAAGRR